MSRSHPTVRHVQVVALSPAQAFNHLVSANAVDAAQDLLNDLHDETLDDCIEEIRGLLHDHGFGIAVQKLSIFVLLVDNRRASWIGARVDTRERGYPRQLPQNASELKEALRHLMRRS